MRKIDAESVKGWLVIGGERRAAEREEMLTLALGELAYFLVWATVALILVGVPVLEAGAAGVGRESGQVCEPPSRRAPPFLAPEGRHDQRHSHQAGRRRERRCADRAPVADSEVRCRRACFPAKMNGSRGAAPHD